MLIFLFVRRWEAKFWAGWDAAIRSRLYRVLYRNAIEIPCEGLLRSPNFCLGACSRERYPLERSALPVRPDEKFMFYTGLALHA
jgi:hypothetical protein